jgi:hypothetical protein|tara:strand:+ start:134 stop:283 length:150 start_codon:yes stop_codon:yes gene_type:complete
MEDYTIKQLKDFIRHMRWLIAVNQNTERTSHQCIWYLKKYEAELKRREN